VVILLVAVIAAGSYLLGSIPVGLLLVRVITGKDVREIGSGRTGGTNTLRAAGPWTALLTVVGDMAKGFLPVLLAHTVLRTQGVESPLVEALAGLVAVIGHNYPIFVGFKGGAGTMTSGGGAVALWPWVFPILAPVGIGAIVLTGHASVGSITVALGIPVIYLVRALLGAGPWEHLIHGLGTTVLTLWALRPNIQRLIEGRERRVVLRVQPQPARVSSQQHEAERYNRPQR
jgi:glycerol-3-phosphate acyltransferase PlsY